MGTISVSLPADGTNATVTQYNTPLTTITNAINGGLDNSNIASGAAIATSKIAQDAGITGASLSPTAISLGSAQIVANVTGLTSTTGAQVTGLTAPVTVPVGGRKVKITGYVSDTANGASAQHELQIWDGVVGSGTKLAGSFQKNRNAGDSTGFMTVIAIVTPSAGSKTYNIGLATNTGSATVAAGSTTPALISVEAI